MPVAPNRCSILNSGAGSWAFEPLANQLSSTLDIPICDQPSDFNYLLHTENTDISQPLFIPLTSIRTASDKRQIAGAFARHGVPTPATFLYETFAAVTGHVSRYPDSEWCLKYPTSCGANGHRLITTTTPEPPRWPTPFILQQFLRQDAPEVFRTYCAGGELFGWVVRRFPPGTPPSPWVAHAKGARYARLGEIPDAAAQVAREALQATDLLPYFGCVDLLRDEQDRWLALEVGTDGLYNYVDRELDCPEMETEILQRIARAFWLQAEQVLGS